MRRYINDASCYTIAAAVCVYVSRQCSSMGRGGNPARHQETEDVPGEMPPGHCDSVGYVVQC